MSASQDLSPTITGATPIEALPAGNWCISGSSDNTVGFPIQDGVYAWINVGRADRARLISAAPDLLAALIDARSQLEIYEFDLTGESFNDLEINAAIAKATSQASGEG